MSWWKSNYRPPFQSFAIILLVLLAPPEAYTEVANCQLPHSFVKADVAWRAYCGWRADETQEEQVVDEHDGVPTPPTVEELRALGALGIYCSNGRWKTACHVVAISRGVLRPSLDVLQKLPNLKSVFCVLNTDAQFAQLSQVKSLRGVILEYEPGISAESFQAFSRLVHLERLCIGMPRNQAPRRPGELSLRDLSMLRYFRNCPKLSEIFLGDAVDTNSGLKFAATIPSLKRLHLACPLGIDAAKFIDITPITNNSTLKQLILTHYHVTMEGDINLKVAAGIEQLTLDHCAIDAASVQRILKTFPLKSLVMSNVTVTGKAPIDFSACKTLQELTLIRSIDRQRDLNSISNCSKLQRLDTRHVTWEKETIQAMRHAPHLKIWASYHTGIALSDYKLPPKLVVFLGNFQANYSVKEYETLLRDNHAKLLAISVPQKNTDLSIPPLQIGQTTIIRDMYWLSREILYNRNPDVPTASRQLLRSRYAQCGIYSLAAGSRWRKQYQTDGTVVDHHSQRGSDLYKPAGPIKPIGGGLQE